MPSIVQLPSAPNTGLSSLASVLLGGATDYANQKRSDTVEARRRGQRLEDIKSERDWTEKIRTQGGEEAQQRLNQLTEDEAAVTGRMDARQRRLMAPEPQPTQAQIDARALAIARMSSGKATPPTAEIEAAKPQAREEAQTVLNQSWQRERLDAQEEQRIDALRLQRIGAEKNTITNIFRKVGLAQAVVVAPPKAQVSQAQPVDVAEVQRKFVEDLREELRKKDKTAAQPTAPGTNRDYTFQGGLLGGIERAAPAVNAGLGMLAEIPAVVDRGVGAIGTGLLTGDYSTPKQGGLASIGSSMGNWFSNAIAESEMNVENEILRTQPHSERAREIRMRRGRSGAPVPTIGIPQTLAPRLQIPAQ